PRLVVMVQGGPGSCGRGVGVLGADGVPLLLVRCEILEEPARAVDQSGREEQREDPPLDGVGQVRAQGGVGVGERRRPFCCRIFWASSPYAWETRPPSSSPISPADCSGLTEWVWPGGGSRSSTGSAGRRRTVTVLSPSGTGAGSAGCESSPPEGTQPRTTRMVVPSSVRKGASCQKPTRPESCRLRT